MAAKVKERVKVTGTSSLIIREDEKHLKTMYKEMYSELDLICKEHRAVIDVSRKGSLVILGTTRGCRKRIRKLYGGCHFFREGSTLELHGFTGD